MNKQFSQFVSLHNHTEVGSPLDGMNDIYELFERAKEIDQPAVAITDHGTLNAHYDCWKASKATGVKLIPGIEAYFTEDLSTKVNRHMVLLAQNEVGYRNILRLGYESYKNQSKGFMGKYTPRISWEHLEQFNEGVVCLTACSSGLIARTLITEENEERAICHINTLNGIFKDRFFLEIQPHSLYHVNKNGSIVDQTKLNESLIKYSHDFNIPYVITCDAHYKDKEHAKYHDMMLAIKDKKALDDPKRFRYGVQDMYLKTHEEIIDFFGRDVALEGMKNSIKISNLCEVPSYLEPKGPILPPYPVKEEEDFPTFSIWHNKNFPELEEDRAYLRYKCIEGFQDKIGKKPPKVKKEYWNRVKKEISILEDKGFSSYMLMVSDYTNWAKKNGIPTGPGRGSAAGSLVAFLTGITIVDPIKYGLIFERFHNKDKKSFPDIDSDFSRPGLVKEYLKQKYGEERVASISNWSKLTPKQIIKDIARTLRIGGDKSKAFKIANKITDSVPDGCKTIQEAKVMSPEFAAYMREYPQLEECAIKLQNKTRNWSVHAAGVVIGDRPLYEIIPLRIDPESGLVVAQWEKTRCEEFGLVKFDILGIKTLEVIDEALKSIHNDLGEEILIENIDLEDQSTYDLISSGHTIGMFQLGLSLAPLCQKIKPGEIEIIADINALGRPSCSKADRSAYIKRKSKLEDTKYRHPILENALEKTYGVSLYEEGMMFIAQDCAKWDLNQADALRKITKNKGKDPELAERTRRNFINDCNSKSGIPYNIALEIWEKEIEPFGKYGFNKSHAVSYSHLSYYTAWLKNHYPTHFICALLNSEDPNSDDAQNYIKEAKRLGISITSPDINASSGGYTIVNKNKIATGLGAIKGVGEAAFQEITKNQPYANYVDFFRKTSGRIVNKAVMQALAKAGAFDTLGRNRKDVFENYAKHRKKVQDAIKKEKDLNEVTLNVLEEEWSRKELLVGEFEVLGRTISGSLHEVFKGFFKEGSALVTPLNQISNKKEKEKVKIEAIINNKIRELKIKNGPRAGQKFAKYLVEDISGYTAEMTVWSEDYIKYKDLLKDGTPIKAICSVGEYMSKKTLTLSSLEKIFGGK